MSRYPNSRTPLQEARLAVNQARNRVIDIIANLEADSEGSVPENAALNMARLTEARYRLYVTLNILGQDEGGDG